MAQPNRIRNGYAKFCCRQCKDLWQEGDIERRIAEGVIRDPATGCLNWQRAITTTGYGYLSFKSQKTLVSHIVALHQLGAAPDNKTWVLHHCDNRRCVEPAHLYWGDATDNIRDAVRRQRHTSGTTRLTAAQVTNIRKRHLAGESIKTLAEEHGVTHSGLSNIVHRRTWRHLA